MNWVSEAHKSWEWLHWMREVMAEDVEPGGTLPMLIRGMTEWDEAIARDRHSVGDLDRIHSTENFVYAASALSRAAKTALEDALKYAIDWQVDDPMNWPDPPEARQRWLVEAKQHWAASHHVVEVVLQAWIVLWNDLAELQGQFQGATSAEIQEQWKAVADQAEQVVSGAAVAAWAQTR
jgi:hypothetical protein